jgi:protein-disulfide isomerase
MTPLRTPLSDGDHIAGRQDAPVTIVEYGDYQCPYCAEAYHILEDVRRHFGQNLLFVFRHFPLVEIHPLAQTAAEAAEFAGSKGSFWEMHRLLFENQESLSPEVIHEEIKSLGLSTQELDLALANEVFGPKVRADFVNGVRSGVNGTPTVYVQGFRHDGSLEIKSLFQAVDAVLEAKSRG